MVRVFSPLSNRAGGCVGLRQPVSGKGAVSSFGAPASPPVLDAFGDDPAIKTQTDWTNRRAPLLREEFQNLIYGRMPAPITPQIISRKPIDLEETRDFAEVEELKIAVSQTGRRGHRADRFQHAHLYAEVGGAERGGPLPVVVMQNFCGNRAIFHRRPQEIAPTITSVYSACEKGSKDWMVEAVLGKYISGPPIKKILDRGYALVTLYAGDVVADNKEQSGRGLDFLSTRDKPRTGALMAWAWTFSRVVDVLSADGRFDPHRIIIWGHSRNGKDALLAAAFDPRIAGVIAQQSGRGGAALTRSKNGETVAEITTSYPFWFTPGFAGYAGKEETLPIDQHQLIALAAPRPILLGDGRADNWADPEGAYRALIGADPVYKLLGSKGLTQQDMQHPELAGDLAFFIRPGITASRRATGLCSSIGWMHISNIRPLHLRSESALDLA